MLYYYFMGILGSHDFCRNSNGRIFAVPGARGAASGYTPGDQSDDLGPPLGEREHSTAPLRKLNCLLSLLVALVLALDLGLGEDLPLSLAQPAA